MYVVPFHVNLPVSNTYLLPTFRYKNDYSFCKPLIILALIIRAAIYRMLTGHTAPRKAHPGSCVITGICIDLPPLCHRRCTVMQSSCPPIVFKMRSPVSVSCKRKLQRSTTGNPVGASHMVRCMLQFCASPSFYNVPLRTR